MDNLATEAKKYKTADEFVKEYILDSQLPPEQTHIQYIKLKNIT